jgi:hypothetical protein
LLKLKHSSGTVPDVSLGGEIGGCRGKLKNILHFLVARCSLKIRCFGLEIAQYVRPRELQQSWNSFSIVLTLSREFF